MRNTILWILALLWLLASYLVQDPPRDPYDAAFRAGFTYVAAAVVLVVSAVLVASWVALIRTDRR